MAGAGRHRGGRGAEEGWNGKVRLDKGVGTVLGRSNDGEIAREIGAKPTAVFQWRKRRGLPANAKAGGLHGSRQEYEKQKRGD